MARKRKSSRHDTANNPGNPVDLLSSGNMLAASLAYRLGMAGLGRVEKQSGIPGLAEVIKPILANTSVHIFGNSTLGLPQEVIPVISLAGRFLSGEFSNKVSETQIQQVQEVQQALPPVQQQPVQQQQQQQQRQAPPIINGNSRRNIRMSELLYYGK